MAYNPRPAPRFDTRSKLDCIYYLQGYCGNGDACTFKHDPFRYAAQVGPVLPHFGLLHWACRASRAYSKLTWVLPLQRNVAPVEKVQEICVFFNRGGCARGDACKFQHVKVQYSTLLRHLHFTHGCGDCTSFAGRCCYRS